MYINPYIFWGLIFTIIGLIFAITFKINKDDSDGEFIIDTSNPEKDIYRLELGKELESLEKRKTLTLKVIHGVISQS